MIITSITYPLDLVHGRMAADMSKKPSLVVAKNASSASNLPKERLYSSVRNCFKKT